MSKELLMNSIYSINNDFIQKKKKKININMANLWAIDDLKINIFLVYLDHLILLILVLIIITPILILLISV